MSVLLAQITIPNKNGLPEDGSINTLHFGTTGPLVDIAATTSITAAILDFYNTPNAVSTRVANLFSPAADTANAKIKFFRLNDLPPRAPLVTAPLPIVASAGIAQPGEVAIVGSFQAVQVSGEPQARKRNRIYLGPCDTSIIDTDASGNPFVSTGMRTAILDGFQRLWTASAADPDWTWVVYSPTIGLVNGTRLVDNGWVDNSFDTQRRRGLKATVRQTKIFV